ncbi:hypothetical protein ACFOOK_20220 [Micromonospora krabiensis]|uniref:hypothetical protein n=1 Tax=Micromonospora krabiensis TaxID=307121 RepID=UPI0036114490
MTSSPGTPPVLLDLWRQSITQDRIAAVGLLLATVCLAVVVLALPVRRRPGRTPLARTAAALLVVLVVAYVWDSVGDAPLSGAFAAGWPALTATLVAAGVLAVSGERGDRFALVSIGALLIAVTAAADLGDLVSLSSSLWSAVDVRRDAFLEVGVAVSAGGGKDLSAAAHAGVALVGPALFAIGALHASRDDLTGSR